MRRLQKLVGVLSSSLVLFAALTCSAKAEIAPRKPEMLDNSRQLIVVTTRSWDINQGTLQQFERANPNQQWQPVGKPWDVVIGRNGIGWAYNFKSYASGNDPIKKEGDGKSPAGAFKLGSAFGFSPTAENGLKLSYIPITPTTVCVDDSKSRYYGKIIDSAKAPAKDWDSAEIMIEKTPAYQEGLVVDFNTQGKAPGAGSCVFMHVSANPNGTAGCTAMVIDNVSKLWNWLDPKANPVLVQLPKAQYSNLQKSWGLPPL